MGTVSELLDIAIGEIGVCESPPNSNNVKYNRWFYKRTVMGSGYPWCMAFCQWVYAQASVKLPSTTTASCTAMMEAAKRNVCFVDRNYKPGDLLLFNFDGKKTVATHCGIAKEVVGNTVYSIEGNTAVGNDTNGGSVMLRARKIRHIVGAVRPKFERKEELDMTKEEFLKSLTDKEAYDLLTKAMHHAETLPEPAASKKEGSWAKLIKMGVINTNTPEALLKRDEFALILGRLGLLK